MACCCARAACFRVMVGITRFAYATGTVVTRNTGGGYQFYQFSFSILQTHPINTQPTWWVSWASKLLQKLSKDSLVNSGVVGRVVCTRAAELIGVPLFIEIKRYST
jgi:hypothetical protein